MSVCVCTRVHVCGVCVCVAWCGQGHAMWAVGREKGDQALSTTAGVKWSWAGLGPFMALWIPETPLDLCSLGSETL